MDSKEAQLRKIVESVSPRTAHQYKSYGDRYVRWLEERGVVERAAAEDELVYRDLPISSHLVHWFLLESVVRGRGEDGDGESRIPTLKKMVSSLKFLHRVCSVHGNRHTLDEKYLENVVKLHSNWVSARAARQSTLPVVKVSLNLWNCYTETLSEKYFRTDLEKLRFLVDFHFRAYTNLSYEQRSRIRLCELQSVVGEPEVVCTDQKTWSSLQAYLPDSSPQVRSHMPMAVRSQALPFLCPLTSLAAYLYLRFYGVHSVTKGDGFPDLLASDTDEHSWRQLPLIRGKSLSDYPREETLSNYYSTVFRYCHLPYKRREYFNKSSLEYPTLSNQVFNDFFGDGSGAKAAAFPSNVPFDFYQIMNFRSPYGCKEEKAAETRLPQGLLVQVFPEVEQYKRRRDELTAEATQFLLLMERLRKRLLLNLPWIFHFFPQHDLFKDPIFQKADFQSYFHQVIGSHLGSDASIVPFDVLPGFDRLSKSAFLDLLMEPLRTDSQSRLVQNPVSVSPPPVGLGVEEIMNKTYQFVQYQTLTNFQMLLSFLSSIFDKLDMKKSSKEFMIHQLNLLQDTIKDNINVSRPQDVEDYLKKEEEAEEQSTNGVPTRKRNNGLLAIDDVQEPESDEDEDETNGDELQDELKFMVNELVGERVRSVVKLQMEHWETRIQDMISKTVRDEMAKILPQNEEPSRKKPRLSTTPSLTNNQSTSSIAVPVDNEMDMFKMNADLTSVENVILEWFTPNPTLNNQCVHSMNKAYGKDWRAGFEKLYKERKLIIEFYIFLVNQKQVDRYEAVAICERVKDTSSKNNDLASLALLLRDWKKEHNNSYEGLVKDL